MRFEWDAKKAMNNVAKHGVTFEEASSCFADARALVAVDEDHSSRGELRFFLFGMSERGRVLTVRYTHRPLSIRIIGAGAWREGRMIYNAKCESEHE